MTTNDRIKQLEAQNAELLKVVIAVLAIPRSTRERDAVRHVVRHAVREPHRYVPKPHEIRREYWR